MVPTIQKINDYNYVIHCPVILDSFIEEVIGNIHGIKFSHIIGKYDFFITIEQAFNIKNVLENVEDILFKYINTKLEENNL